MQQLITKFLSLFVLCVAFVCDVFAAPPNPCYDVGTSGNCGLFNEAVVQTEAAEGLIKVAMKADATEESKNGNRYYVLKGTLTKLPNNRYKYTDSTGKIHHVLIQTFIIPFCQN